MSEKNLKNKEAIAKLKELAEGIDFAMMSTDLTLPPFHIVPMSTKKVDEDGNIWFLSGRNSNHNKHIEEQGRLLLTYSDKSSMEFLTVYGAARIITKKEIYKEFYNSSDDMWFEGVDDPNVSAIKVLPSDVHYWDTKSGKFISLLKMGVGAITGNQPDISETGNLDIN